MKINQKEEQRIIDSANKTIEIIKAIRKGKTANEIVNEIGCNYSVAKYYIKLLTQ